MQKKEEENNSSYRDGMGCKNIVYMYKYSVEPTRAWQKERLCVVNVFWVAHRLLMQIKNQEYI